MRKFESHNPTFRFTSSRAKEAISAGVTGYLQKETGVEQYTVLANAVEIAVERYRAEALKERVESLE